MTSGAGWSTTRRDVQPRRKKCITRAHNKQGQVKRHLGVGRFRPISYRVASTDIYLLRRNKFSGNICRTLCRASWNIRLRKEISPPSTPYLSPWIKLFLLMPIVRESEEATSELTLDLYTSVSLKKFSSSTRNLGDYFSINRIQTQV